MTNLRDLEAAATPGPWKATTAGMDAHVVRPSGSWMQIGDSWYHPEHTADAALIAASRNALPLLLDVVDAARVAVTEGVGYGHPVESDTAVMFDLSRALTALDNHLEAQS